ncbi:MAG: molybdopterin-dependent oxidoreductase, partial [Gammaproteobacteria bacterium]|nr:molybdopterin-dependent oxidoreductase [Gammaproteobacteria bacterium]
HPGLTEIRAVAAALARATGASLGYLPEGGNAAGAAMLGFVPNRAGADAADERDGLNIEKMLSSPRHAYLLHGIEPDSDLADSALADAALKSADTVMALTAFASDNLLDCCDILLPVATFAETEGTFVNAEGRWQSFAAAAKAPGDARPAWRVLRVLADALGARDCAYQSIDEIRSDIEAEVGRPEPDNAYAGEPELDFSPADVSLDRLDVPVYSVDPVVRRSEPLQQTRVARERGGDDSTGAERKSA